ncbi:FAD-binding oxidoreductase [Paenibacillus sp. FJAT-26967]|uniref:NAD(P)/FAD-dependent oxidoreductase n=1 Tax=Paenibacillus sp. FJAT-26967 TaxID=1729690 RepID=UPI000837DCCE|nr:FAD-binding oxidoreductase [Paenibacillus sp. FJAT-26967]
MTKHASSDCADVVIIGGGINGTSLAFHLAREKAGKIVVLEKSQLSTGATGKSGGLVRCNYTNEAEARLALTSLEYFQNWEGIVGGSCGFDPCGLVVIVPPGKLADLKHNMSWQRAMGIPIRLIARDEVNQIDSSMYMEESIDYVGFEESAGYADPNAANYSFMQASRDLGAEYRIGTGAVRIVHSNNQVQGVLTNQGMIHSPVVVVAAGIGANRLFAPLGLDLGLTPTLTRIVTFRWTPERTQRHPTCMDYVHNTWFRPTSESCTLMGSESGVRPIHGRIRASESVPDHLIREYRELLASRYPVMNNANARGNWAGLFMTSPDSRPVIGPLEPYSGLYTVAGDSGTSFKTAPAIGRGLSELILHGKASTVDLSPFYASRFDRVQPWVDSHRYSQDNATISR